MNLHERCLGIFSSVVGYMHANLDGVSGNSFVLESKSLNLCGVYALLCELTRFYVKILLLLLQAHIVVHIFVRTRLL